MDFMAALTNVCTVTGPVQEALKRIVKRRILPKGTILLNEGQIANEVHYIEKGLIRAYYHQDKKEITSWMANEGRFIWPLPSYLLRRPSRETIQTLETTTVLSMDRQELDQLKREYEVFDELQCRIMERYIVLYDLRVQLLLMKAEERFDAYGKLFPELYRRVPLRYIATYLGIDPATLSRIRGNYKKKTKADKN